MVIDSSALLAILFNEAGAEQVATRMEQAESRMMTAVNYTECLIRVLDRAPAAADSLEQILAAFALDIVPVDRDLASAAARARLRFPSNLGDCYAYALAKQRGVKLLTLDQDFARTDVELVSLAGPG